MASFPVSPPVSRRRPWSLTQASPRFWAPASGAIRGHFPATAFLNPVGKAVRERTPPDVND
jgi:hypothetical protein